MQIPLDYYRILGLPIQTSAEQLQQAYRDRLVQLPRWEYSEGAITARKELIEKAYTVLSEPEQRADYDANYFARTYERPDDNAAAFTENRPEFVSVAIDPNSPSIEIADAQFVGALLILQELGEYELVLNLGLPYLRNSNVAAEGEQKSKLGSVRPDIVLTVALAYLELGREQWQQGKYENAASSLEHGQQLLLQTGILPNVKSEIAADLYKLRPYRILELLSQPEENVAERQLGLKLLQDVLQERGGIDGTSDEGSGLSLDDFLRFIQQLRSYLTVAEQQTLFEAESKRPSAVATFLAVYALIARGFVQRLPVLIRQAKLLLMRLGKRQDLYLEQAVCSLLLGQTVEASRNLELSQEYEPLAFIQEHSQDSPDLLPGLCLYSEQWLQTEVFPHFRDLAHQPASLKDYFADEQVQAYLEALPTQVGETNELAEVELLSPTYRQTPYLNQSPRHEGEGTRLSPLASSSSGVATVPVAEQITTANTNQNRAASPNATALVQVRSPQQPRKRTRNPRRFGFLQAGKTRFSKQGSSSTAALGNMLKAKQTRLILLAIAGVLGIVVLGFLVNQTYARLKQAFFPEPSLQGEQPLVQLNQPILPIPDPNSKLLAAKEPLNQETAEQVIQNWLSTKGSAFGSNHAVKELEQILVNPALSQWQRLVQNDRAANRYRQYKHSLKVNFVQTTAASPDTAQVEATVNEVAQIYEDGQLNQNASYDENLRVRYDLVRKNAQWRIREMKVLR